MPPKQLFQKYGSKNKKTAARAAVAAARATLIANRRSAVAPLRTGGFFSGRRDELKAIDTAAADYKFIIPSTGVAQCFVLLNGVATGTDFTDRIGRKILMKSLFIRGLIYPQDTTVLNNMCRMIVVYDKQANGTAPVITDVLKTDSATAQLNLNNRDRFEVIFDKQWTAGAMNTTATQTYSNAPVHRSVKLYKRLNHEVQFGGTTNAIGSIQTGSLYLFTLGIQSDGDGHLLGITVRIRFKDS